MSAPTLTRVFICDHTGYYSSILCIAYLGDALDGGVSGLPQHQKAPHEPVVGAHL